MSERNDAEKTIGTLRPTNAEANLHAAIWMHEAHIPYEIKLATVPASYPNARWKLVPSGSFVIIQSEWTIPPVLAMTAEASAPGSRVLAAAATGGDGQLWSVETLGRMYRFVSKTTGLVLEPLNRAPVISALLSLGLRIDSGNDSFQWWVFEN
jgi:hypothetical protein